MTFVSTGVVRKSDTDFVVTGDLTIKDVTKPIELDVEFLGEGLGGIRGYSGWTSSQEHAEKKAVEDAKLEQAFAPFAGKAIDVLATDPPEGDAPSAQESESAASEPERP